MVEEVFEDAGGEDFWGDDGWLSGDEEDVDGDGGAPEFLEFFLDGGVWFGFVCFEEDDAFFLGEGEDFLGVGDFFVHLAGDAPLGGEVDEDGGAFCEEFFGSFLAPF